MSLTKQEIKDSNTMSVLILMESYAYAYSNKECKSPAMANYTKALLTEFIIDFKQMRCINQQKVSVIFQVDIMENYFLEVK